MVAKYILHNQTDSAN